MEVFYGILQSSPWLPWGVALSVFALVVIGFLGAPLWVWSLYIVLTLVGFGASLWLTGCVLGVLVIFNIPLVRRHLISRPIMALMKALQLIPAISDTERTALEAGVVWKEADLFSGKPDFTELMNQPYPHLSPEEQSFLDNEVEQLCGMVDDWEIWKTRKVPDEVMNYIRSKGFLGMIIPKEYGGLGFSHAAHSAVIQKLASRSVPATIYVMVPNSLGPAELLLHYGTSQQKEQYLGRLADGTEIPCFGLTEPKAGSDAGSLESSGELFKGQDGRLYLRLNWRKRWISLAAIATLIGLAFRLRDPENHLGHGEDVGITCALIPANTSGVILGRRHDPLGVPFHNCPMEGHDVVVPADEAIIGGLEKAGEGWGMLMESLGAGRGISLPAQSTGGAKLATRVATAHSVARQQFGRSIADFEGVEEHLARIAGDTYYMDALRQYVLSALDQGVKSPVASAIAKYNSTERGRQVINDAMDIRGGAGISMGPRNLLATSYIGIPIPITVEGANILTRTLMIFGQGALRAHPFAYKEVTAVENDDVKAFDEAFWGHVGHVVQNMFRTVVLSLTRGRAASAGRVNAPKKYFYKLAWTSASFAILADIAMAGMGAKLKVKEKITGRFADILSWMFVATAVLRRYIAEGSRAEDLPFVDYSMKVAFHRIQEAFDGIYSNIEIPFLSWFFRGPVRWWSRLNFISFQPSDALTKQVAELALQDGEQRERLCGGTYRPSDLNEPLAQLEHTYRETLKANAVTKKIKKAMKKGQLEKEAPEQAVEKAVEAGIITREQAELVGRAESLRWSAIQVDDFSEDEYLPGGSVGKRTDTSERGKSQPQSGTGTTAS